MERMQQWRVVVVAVCLFLGWLAPACGAEEEIKCAVCGKNIETNYFVFQDKSVGGGDKTVCNECAKLETRCFLCGLPVKTNFSTLKDGRLLCERDDREAIHLDEDARKICEDVQDELNRNFSRFMVFPTENVVISFVDRFSLENLFKTTGYAHCVDIFGAAENHMMGDKKTYFHSISILSDLKKPRLMAVFAHESTHVWIAQNVSKQRQAVLSAESVEGLCELIAYKLMEVHQESFEMAVIRKNDYTKGQINAMLEADRIYGFNAILDWMRTGQDEKLDLEHLERVNLLEGTPIEQTAGAPTFLYLPTFVPPAPDKLVLKGISGTKQKRFALINDATFEVAERHKVRVGETNVSVRCLEIREKSVLIEREDSNEKQELFLRPDE